MVKQLFNNDWYFSEQPLKDDTFSLAMIEKTNLKWDPVDVPHDWLITDTNNLYRDSEGWYRKTFWVDEETLKLRHYLQFDGIYMDSTIFVNGKLVSEWKNGYTSFEIDLSEFLTLGDNQIFIRVVHQGPNSRWYSGAGLYRNIWHRVVNNVHIATNGLYLHTQRKDRLKNEWELKIETKIVNCCGSSSSLVMEHTIRNQQNEVVLIEEKAYQLAPLNQEQTYTSVIRIENPLLWDTDKPYLYKVATKIKGAFFADQVMTPLGFRTIELDAKEGLFLNDQSLKIQGVCQHHDLGALGSALNYSALRRQLTLLKEMGVNALRTAHNPAAPELLDLADEMGFLVQSELTDVWKHSKTTYDYARFFDEWIEEDVANWVLRERNHPSIFMWSIGNEVYDTHGREDGLATTQLLIDLVKKYDPLANGSITFGSNYLLWEGTQKAADLLKIVGYNYGENLYEKHHQAHPDWVIYGSETCSVVQSRGIYHFPLSQSILADDDRQCSSLGNSTTSWGAKSVEDCLMRDRDMAFSLGQFIWTGFDYLGEPTPYSTKNSYFGQLDTAGFKKDSFYVFQASWVPYQKQPMIHLFPYWDFSEGQLIDVRLCSNAPTIELFFNNQSLGKRSNDVKHSKRLIHDWSIPYQRGKLTAKAYDLQGQIIAEDCLESFGDVTDLHLSADKLTLNANGQDLVFIEINGLDQQGIQVENANNRVHLELSGPGRLVGIDNGDSTDYDQFKENSKRLFSGKLLAIIAPTFEAGTITIKATSKGLPPATIDLESQKVELVKGLANALTRHNVSTIAPELPVRKIEIESLAKSSIIDSPEQEVELQAKVHPENADYQDVEWRLTDSKGIDSRIAQLETIKEAAVVKPIADGQIFVRCGTKNGSQTISLYSLLDLTIDGIKEASLNPYESVSGGLFTRSNVALTNGNERGVATLRGEESWVIFDDVDFGNQGSAELMLSLFPLEGNVFTIDIWQGTPYESTSCLVDTVEYTQGTIWNTYQEQAYRLAQPFKGKQTIAFVFNQKVHIKEFTFEKVNRTYTELSVLDNDLMYGDSFTIKETWIEGIGNNVTFQFNDLDFGEIGTTKLLVTGQSPVTQNSIQLKFSDGKHEERRILEFEVGEGYQTKAFDFELISGKQTVEFIFLPGSNFNFKSFRFLKTLANQEADYDSFKKSNY